MKKKDILKILNVDTVNDGNVKNLVTRISDTLNSIDDSVEIDEFTSWTNFKKAGGLKRYKTDSSQDICAELNTVLTELQTWIERNKSILSVNNTPANNKRGLSQKLIDILPVIIAVIVLVVGLSLGLTVFNESQDALYFVLESVKDIFGGIMSFVVVQQCVNHSKRKPNKTGVVVVGSAIGIISLVFAIVLWLSSYMAIIERFTQWGKLTYLWVSLTLCCVVIVCAVSVIWYLCAYFNGKNSKNDKRDNV